MKIIYAIIIALLAPYLASTQGSFNMTLHTQYNPTVVTSYGGAKYNDVWGYTDATGAEYALVGTPDSVLIFEVNDCWTAKRLNAFSSGSTTLWRDIKTYSNYSFSVCDGTFCNEGLSILDMNTVYNSSPNVIINTSFFTKAHNIYIDEANARLYVVGAPGINLIILDISIPTSPSLVANVDFSVVSGIAGDFYIHDVYVKNNIAYCSHGNDGAWYAWDMSNITDTSGTGITLFKSVVTGDYNHSTWLSDNGNYAYFAEEIPKGKELGIIDLNTQSVIKRFSDPHLPTSAGSPTPHNPYVVGNDLFVSHYEDGVVVFDITDPLNPTKKAYYDTYINSGYSGYEGNWGVYPFFNSGCIVATDMTYGVHFLKVGTFLPVEWLAFSADQKGDRSVELLWSTATEINNHYFEVERSLDGMSFHSIHEQQGKGTTYDTQKYSFRDLEVPTNKVYYRIKQVDYDGKYSYTEIVSVNFNNNDSMLKLFPNPSSEYIEVSNLTQESQAYTIIDAQGKIWQQGMLFKSDAIITVSKIPTGNYILTVEQQGTENLVHTPLIIVK